MDARFSAIVENVSVAFAVLIVVAGAFICIQPECFPSHDQRLLKQLLAAVESRRPESLDLATEYRRSLHSDPLAVALAAEAAAINFQHQAAIDLYRILPADGSRWEFLANVGLARRCAVLGRMTDQERHLRRALDLNPHDIDANSRLGHLLQLSGRSWEAIPYFFYLVRAGKCRGDELLGVAACERFFRADDRQELLALNTSPPDVLAKLAVARREAFNNRQAESERLLKEVIQVAPELGEAQGRLGRIVFDRGDSAEFQQWYSQLPFAARSHPEVWFVTGMQARRLGQVEGAVRCFLEALTQSPNHVAATVQIAGCLDQLQRAELATEFAHRGEALASIEASLNVIRNDVDPSVIRRAIHSFGRLGRYWEAAGWANVMTFLYEVPKDDARKEVRHWLAIARQQPLQNAVERNPVAKLRLKDFAEPRWNSPSATSAPKNSPVDDVPWAFQDDAQRMGIRFRYYEGTTEETRLQHIFNVVGGGMAAVDYDLDGWCDLYLAQGNDWHNPAPQPAYPDRLFRNLPDQPFVDVTANARLGDLSFTHGVTAGDFDQDGFPDLYLGNLGANRLYHNNGDGTFTEVADTANVAGNEWTTSSVFADLNGDGLPDLYVANYSLLEETANKICRRPSGQPMACTPDLLTAEFHRLYVNNGDGTFRDVTSESGMRVPNGRGLGLVAWNFGDDQKLGLFVANDTSPNFLFVNEGTDANGVPKFREEGAVRGVAFDIDGNSQACMGVAAGDATGDGLIDMYITNFFGESDTLYIQRPDGMFDDASRPYNLRDAGFWTLGFGTQFIDFDGDGWEDLVATNGHVDQQSRRGDPDRTPPQLFRNVQGRKFEEISPTRLGSFFQQGYLGRGLAKFDWNRDGHTDFAVSHLHGDFALVTNTTPTKSSSLVVRLAGRSGAREPTGALVTARYADRKLFRLLTAGDGYLVTNERYVQFSIPVDQPDLELEVRWPNGTVQKWSRIVTNQEVLLIEGRSQAVVLNAFADHN